MLQKFHNFHSALPHMLFWPNFDDANTYVNISLQLGCIPPCEAPRNHAVQVAVFHLIHATCTTESTFAPYWKLKHRNTTKHTNLKYHTWKWIQTDKLNSHVLILFHPTLTSWTFFFIKCNHLSNEAIEGTG